MKRLVMCGVVALALAGCTQSEVLNISSDRAIGFDAYTGKGTRAVNDITGGGSATFNKFIVYGSYANSEGQKTVVFNGVEVSYTTSGTESSWTYANEQYWQNGDYKFVAYSDGNGALSGEPTASYTHDDGLQIQNYVVGEKDLIFATIEKPGVDKSTYEGTPVNLKFSHLLSKVKFTFTETFADNLTVEVSNLKIVNSKIKGTYKYDTDAYKWEIGTDTKEITYKTTPVVVSTSYKPEECYVLPQSTNGLTASFTVTVKDALDAVVMRKDFTGDDAVSLNVANATEWQNGFAYNYTAELTPAVIDPNAKPIQFTATADTWKENENGDGGLTITKP